MLNSEFSFIPVNACNRHPNVATCLTLQFEEVRAFLVHIGPLSLQDLVETLALQAAACHGEVDECHTRTQVWWELNLHGQEKT